MDSVLLLLTGRAIPRSGERRQVISEGRISQPSEEKEQVYPFIRRELGRLGVGRHATDRILDLGHAFGSLHLTPSSPRTRHYSDNQRPRKPLAARSLPRGTATPPLPETEGISGLFLTRPTWRRETRTMFTPRQRVVTAASRRHPPACACERSGRAERRGQGRSRGTPSGRSSYPVRVSHPRAA